MSNLDIIMARSDYPNDLIAAMVELEKGKLVLV
jgi:hypothetical protein